MRQLLNIRPRERTPFAMSSRASCKHSMVRTKHAIELHARHSTSHSIRQQGHFEVVPRMSFACPSSGFRVL